jgi:hypothetical protein
MLEKIISWLTKTLRELLGPEPCHYINPAPAPYEGAGAKGDGGHKKRRARGKGAPYHP